MSALSFVAKRFVAGETRDRAISALGFLQRDGMIATMDFLGENVSSESEAREAADEYLKLLDTIQSSAAKSNVSMKLTQMGLDVSEDFCVSNVGRILDRASSQRNFVRIDMESSAYTDKTLRVFRRLFETYPTQVGIVIQAYLHRTEADAIELAKIKAPVRVCKGAYKEPPALAFSNMDDIRQNFKRLVELLLKSGTKTAIATHDESLIRWAVEWTSKEGISRDLFEFQMLYGLRRKRARELAKLGYVVRLYVPYGTHWFPYFYRRLRERKENVFFILKSLVTD